MRSHVQQLFMGKSRIVNVEFAIRTRDDEIRYWDFTLVAGDTRAPAAASWSGWLWTSRIASGWKER